MRDGSNLDSFGSFWGDHNSAMDLIAPQLNFLPSGSLTPPDWGVILAEGPDTGTFLQGQLTHDVLLLAVGQARFAGYCSAKGRLLASFIVLKVSNDQYLLVCHRDLIATMVKRLSMFVMRAKVKLSDACAQYALRGLLGSAAEAVGPDVIHAPSWQVTQHQQTYAIKLPSAASQGRTVLRYLCLAHNDERLQSQEWFASPPHLSANTWQLAEVLSGVSMVQASTQELFVPQMLNYESVEGVSFKKGCYPGQEVVARSQFRGTIKRRAFIVSCDAPLSVAQEVFASDDETQACGTVSSAASVEATSEAPAGTWWGIASLQLSAVAHKLTLGSSTGPQVHLHALPYPLLEDI